MKTRIKEYARTEQGQVSTRFYKEIAWQYMGNLVCSLENTPDEIREKLPRQPLMQLDDIARAIGIDKATLLNIAIDFFITNASCEKTADNVWEFSVSPSNK